MTAADGRRPPKYADVDDVRAAAVEWAVDHLECRDTGHHWQPEDVAHIRSQRFYRIQHRCARCDTRRLREMSETGHVYAQTYDYAPGYQAKGLGRIVGEAKDAVRLAAVTRGPVTEIKRRTGDEVEPRFSATRRDLEDGGR